MRASKREQQQIAARARWQDPKYRSKHGAATRRASKTRWLDASLVDLADAGLGAAQIAEITEVPVALAFARLREIYKLHMEFIWDLVSKPVKFPAPRRRRDDHERPKAA